MSLFSVKPDFDLGIMRPGQSLIDITTAVLSGLTELFQTWSPDVVLVHGDTNTTFAASLAAYYHQIPVHHVEAGLRTGNMYSPWPEEGNRKLTAAIASFHYAPTESSRNNLLREGIDNNKIKITGNTVIDALLDTTKILDGNAALRTSICNNFPFLSTDLKTILVTGHRRENFGQGFENICLAIASLAKRDDIQIVYPVHLNPNVQEPVKRHLSQLDNVHLISTQGYIEFVYLMMRSHIILTDSGGVQEEAPSLGIPVLVMRDTTERPEALSAGTVELVGTNADTIVNSVARLLNDHSQWKNMSKSINPYGDGNASSHIINELYHA